jgi:hypothetical protein
LTTEQQKLLDRQRYTRKISEIVSALLPYPQALIPQTLYPSVSPCGSAPDILSEKAY